VCAFHAETPDARWDRPEIAFAASKPFRQTGIAALMGNVCASTIGQAGWQKDQLAAFLIVPQF
jgi:hypothetical protein